MILTGLAMMALVTLGGVLEGERLVREGLVVVIAFGAFYVRRFVPHRAGFTTFGFVLYVVSTVLPGGWSRVGEHLLAQAGGLAAAFVVFFFVLPRDLGRAFRHAVCLFSAATGNFLRAVADGLDRGRRDPPPEAASTFADLQEVLAFCQRLVGGLPKGSERDRLEAVLGYQYRTRQALILLQDGLQRLPCPDPVLGSFVSRMGTILRQLEGEFAALAARHPEQQPAGPEATAAAAIDALEADLLGPGPADGSCLLGLSVVLFSFRRLELLQDRLGRDLAALGPEVLP
jgi:hypothetical protein